MMKDENKNQSKRCNFDRSREIKSKTTQSISPVARILEWQTRHKVKYKSIIIIQSAHNLRRERWESIMEVYLVIGESFTLLFGKQKAVNDL